MYVDSKRYDKVTGIRHGFESAANIEEKKANEENDNHFEQQLSDIAIAATADKEHIQQMTNSTEDLLKIIKEQQAQIKELLRQNGMLIAKVGTNNPTPNNPPPHTLRRGQKVFHPREYYYTDEDKAAARTLIAAINAGTKEAVTSENCMVYNTHPNTSCCYKLEKNAGQRQRGWRTWFA